VRAWEVLVIQKKDIETKQIILKISKPQYEEMILNYVTEVVKLIQNTINCIAVIREIENKHFDGMSLFSQEPEEFNFSIERVEESLESMVETHNHRIREAIKLFNRTALGFWEFQLENIERYLLSAEHKIDQDWVTKQVKGIEEEVRAS
jgi:hypothetical protein